MYLGMQRSGNKPDKNIVKLQQQYLIEKGIWLEDEKATSLLNSM